ncbi:hypothetical protein IKF84_02850 [Candidatus Saccharibacteria bacterium]|nr:hypothetical protein [Candidatus Saccharibacteria bacterium]
MLQKRKRILMASSLGMLLLLVSFLTLSIMSRAFATMEHLGYVAAELTESAEAQTATVSIKATDAIDAYSISADMAVHETTTGDTNFTLTGMTYSDKFVPADVASNEIGESVGRFIWLAGGSEGVEFAADEVILTGTYEVAAGAAAGNYEISLSNLALMLSGSGGSFAGDLTAEVTINAADKPQQDLGFTIEEEEKTWGDANFTYEAVHETGDGAVTYSSVDTTVATVDSETGEVEIVGVGDTFIVATAAETETYAETVASYKLTVNKKTVNITAASVSDKIYDGTTMATIVTDSITFDLETRLDYEAEANFVDANVGTDKDVAVVVTLVDESADYYELSNDTYNTTATIRPFPVNLANVLIPDDEIYYSGKENEPDVIVMVQLNGVTDTVLTEGTDYTVEYEEDTVTAGDKSLTVTTMGNYTDGGDLVKDYTVNPYTITNADIALEYTTVRYSGEAKTPAAHVMIGDFEVDSDEFTVGYSDDNVNPGPVNVTVTAKDDMNITGSAEATFEIIAKEVLNISGISSQSVTYTGSPVVLAGTLTVGANTDGITVADVVTKWYDGETELASAPIAAGNNYKVVYSAESTNYKGSLEVPFVIAKAVSPEPAEMSADFKVAVGTALSAIPGTRTTGFAWLNPTGTVTAGDLSYAATYTYNDDADNYTTLNLSVPVYGLIQISVSAVVNGAGGTVEFPTTALEGDTITFKFTPAANYEIDKVTLNALNVTSSVVDNKLSVVAGSTDVDLVVKYHRIYTVTDGDGAAYVALNGEEATFKIDADLALFTAGGKVYVDGMLINEGFYRYASGSTVITLTEEFIATLPSGTHTLSVVFADGGVARAAFTVSNPKKDAGPKAPDTGFFTAATNAKIAGFTTIAISLVGLSVVFKKRFARTKVDFDKK